MNDQQHRDDMMPKDSGKIQVSETMPKAVLDLQAQHQWLKDDQAGKRGQILVFKFQIGDFIGSTHYFAFAILHLGWPPSLGILVIYSILLYPISRPPFNLLPVYYISFLCT
jgi:hypothetical protein